MSTSMILLVVGGVALLLGIVYWLTRPRPTVPSGSTSTAPSGGSSSGPDPTAVGAGIGAALGGLLGYGIDEAINSNSSAEAAEGGA